MTVTVERLDSGVLLKMLAEKQSMLAVPRPITLSFTDMFDKDGHLHPLMWAVKLRHKDIDMTTCRKIFPLVGHDPLVIVSKLLELPYNYVEGWTKGYGGYQLDPHGFYNENFLAGFNDGRGFRVVYPPQQEG